MLDRTLAALILVAAVATAPAHAASAAPAASSAAQGPATAVETTSVTATVVSVDVPTRVVTLKGEGGNVIDVVVAPEVPNLDEVKPGDLVTLRYTQAIAARILAPGEKPQDLAVSATASKPGAPGPITAGAEVTALVRIDAVDVANNTVTLTGPGGDTETIVVQRPEMRARLKTLKPGDRVFITYSESVAVSLTHAKR